MTSAAEVAFTLKQPTINVAMVAMSWSSLVKYVAEVTVVPYVLVTVTLAVMANHILTTQSIVYVEPFSLITQGNVVVEKW